MGERAMSMSSGTRTLLGEVASWAACAAMVVVGVTHYSELKTIAADLLGLPTPAQVAEAEAQAAQTRAAEQEAPKASGSVELKAGANGHFHTEAEINGRPVEVLVDTGASMVALTYEDAESAGIYVKRSDFTGSVSTANGVSRVAPVMIERISIGDITVRNVKAAVVERGKLQTTLLGMTFLGQLERFEMRSGVLVLEE